MVAMGKSNDWLMWWQWASQMTDWCVGGCKSNDWCSNVVLQWYCGRGQVVLLTDVVPVGKSNDWLKWWQGASQMSEWCGDMVTLYV